MAFSSLPELAAGTPSTATSWRARCAARSRWRFQQLLQGGRARQQEGGAPRAPPPTAPTSKPLLPCFTHPPLPAAAGRGGQHPEAGEAVQRLQDLHPREGPRQGAAQRRQPAPSGRLQARAGTTKQHPAAAPGLGWGSAARAAAAAPLLGAVRAQRSARVVCCPHRRWRRPRATSMSAVLTSPTGCTRPRCSPCAPS